MTPDDFPEIKRDAVTTDELIAYQIVQAQEYAMEHAPTRPQYERDAMVRIYVIYSFTRDRGDKALLRHSLDELVNRHKWIRERVHHAA